MSNPPNPYPLFYRLFFTYLDPLICIWGAYMDFFDPTLVLSSHFPEPTADMGHAMILRQRGGGMLNFGFVSAVLLRYTADIHIWRIVQFADLLVDITYFWAVWGVLDAQGRLDPGTWRAEDWGSIGITGTAFTVRALFLAGAGVKKVKKMKL
ncbi:hypothetical protein CC78DRAFT_315136 [Lojkania enalia]|uniref:DUF7704 domain-containing protein n=1 Tax=Lojkania enalia TaxID=147567 RepID=A0A9P4K7N4_9PLEO|nr:hypothetical protein CC78DRAFT_315136 [Didymosphaeria enalia]